MKVYFKKLTLLFNVYYVTYINYGCDCSCKLKNNITQTGSKLVNKLKTKGIKKDPNLYKKEDDVLIDKEGDEELKRNEDEEERIRKQKEEEQRLKIEAEERIKKQKEDEQRLKIEEEERIKKQKEDEEKRIKEEEERKKEEGKKLDLKKGDLESEIRNLELLLISFNKTMNNKKFDSINIFSTGSGNVVKCNYFDITRYFKEIKDIEYDLKSVDNEAGINEISIKIDKYNSIIQNIKAGIDAACEELENEIDKFKKQSESILTTILSTEKKINECPELKKYIEENLDENHVAILKGIKDKVNGVIDRLKEDISTNTLKANVEEMDSINKKLNEFLEKIEEYDEIKSYGKFLKKKCGSLYVFLHDSFYNQEINFIESGKLNEIYVKMSQLYVFLPSEDVGKEITYNGKKTTYESLKNGFDEQYKLVCILVREIKELIDEVRNYLEDNYKASTIDEVREKLKAFKNRINKIKQDFNDKLRELLFVYHGGGTSNINLDKRITEFSNFIGKKLNKK